MGIRLRDLESNTRQVTVEYLGETITVEYFVNIVTPQFLDDAGNLPEQIKKVVKTWDIVDEAGNPIPPVEIAERLPVALLARILEAVTGDMRAALEKKA